MPTRDAVAAIEAGIEFELNAERLEPPAGLLDPSRIATAGLRDANATTSGGATCTDGAALI